MPRGPLAGVSLALLAACGSAQAPAPPPLPGAQATASAPPPPPLPAAAAPGPTPEEAAEGREKVRLMVARVATARGLPVLREVGTQVLDRAHVLARIRAHVDKEMPKDVVDYQGEVLAALELVPAGYDFVEGAYKLIQGRIAGFYEPEDQTMYLVDDLSDEEAEETLAHELVHALQDQSFHLGPLLKYMPGEGDRLTAVHALIEGDATSAMLDVVAGSAFNFSETMLRRILAASTAFSPEGVVTPTILQSSLTAPYADGFSFVQGRRGKGGWPAVDAAFRALPTTTEQLLHADKYEAGEPAVPVGELPVGALGGGFRVVIDDVTGEQGLRLMLEEWAPRARAEQAAAGWGGDRYIVARRDGGDDQHAIAVGLRFSFDAAQDAVELADVLKARFGARCRERPALGPLAWKQRGKEVVIAAGPYERAHATRATKSAGGCAGAEAWAAELLKPAKGAG